MSLPFSLRAKSSCPPWGPHELEPYCLSGHISPNPHLTHWLPPRWPLLCLEHAECTVSLGLSSPLTVDRHRNVLYPRTWLTLPPPLKLHPDATSVTHAVTTLFNTTTCPHLSAPVPLLLFWSPQSIGLVFNTYLCSLLHCCLFCSGASSLGRGSWGFVCSLLSKVSWKVCVAS